MKINFDILTLFPEYFSSCFSTSLLGKAIQKELVQIHLHALRDYAVNTYGKVDDAPYGGGQGMVLMIEPLARALQVVQAQRDTHVILLGPRGRRVDQDQVKRLYNISQEKSLVLICGHYEGVDERVAEHLAQESLRVGDYVLSGGEPAAAVLVDVVSRLAPGFMGNELSVREESFEKQGYIEYPHYTRPPEYNGMKVPQVLLSGHHQEIARWREEHSLSTQLPSNAENTSKPK